MTRNGLIITLTIIVAVTLLIAITIHYRHMIDIECIKAGGILAKDNQCVFSKSSGSK